jgi:Methyltransferase domain
MSGFAAEWLALREPYDRQARNPAVLDAAAASLAGHPSVTIADLACGTGSTLRALSPRVAGQQNWRLIDNNLGLLARASASGRSNVNVLPTPLDLNRDLEAALDGPVDLVTASALLDLVSEDWLERLVVEIAARNVPLYAALTYDGRIAFDPSDPGDAAIVTSVNSHQQGDKGFGPALGPAAATAAITRLEAVGYSVIHGAAEWKLGQDDRKMQTETLSGWAAAARETGDMPLPDIVGWLTRRRDAVAAGSSSIRVGHLDIFARPTGTR